MQFSAKNNRHFERMRRIS